MKSEREPWPELDWRAWETTASMLHMLLQIVGKTRLALTPLQNHWWNAPLYVTARGLSTSVLPLPTGDDLDIEFDFVDHRLLFRTSRGDIETVPLVPQTVSTFFA